MTNVARTDPTPAVRHTGQTPEQAYAEPVRYFREFMDARTMQAIARYVPELSNLADAMASQSLAVIR